MRSLESRLSKVEEQIRPAAEEAGEPEVIIWIPDNGRGRPEHLGSHRIGKTEVVIYEPGGPDDPHRKEQTR